MSNSLPTPPKRTGLPHIGLSLKVLFTGYLIVVGFGLAMAGVQILLTHGMADGKFGLSIDDIVYSYYGNRGDSKLEAKLDGTMKDKADVHDRASIVKWVQAGSPEDQWDREIQGVFAKNCIKCHGAIPNLADFTKFEVVKSYAKIDMGASIHALTRVSHIHLFGIAFIFFFVGYIFSQAVNIPPMLKATAIGFPFAFLMIDILMWWVIKWYPLFAIVEMGAGVGYMTASGYMIVTSLYQMWCMPPTIEAQTPD
jgi:hypothetical protein